MSENILLSSQYTINGFLELLEELEKSDFNNNLNVVSAFNEGQDEVRFRWNLTRTTNHPYILYIHEKTTNFYIHSNRNLEEIEKYAFREGILKGMNSLSSTKNRIYKDNEDIIYCEDNMESVINGVFLYETTVKSIETAFKELQKTDYFRKLSIETAEKSTFGTFQDIIEATKNYGPFPLSFFLKNEDYKRYIILKFDE